MSYQLKDLISNISTGVEQIDNFELQPNDDACENSFELLEAKLINKAKQEFLQMEKTRLVNEDDDDDESDTEMLHLNDLSIEQKEMLQSLLLASVADLENCCDDCLSTYHDISEYINSKALEFNQFNEYLERLNEYEYLLNQHETEANMHQLAQHPESLLDYDYEENYCEGTCLSF